MEAFEGDQGKSNFSGFGSDSEEDMMDDSQGVQDANIVECGPRSMPTLTPTFVREEAPDNEIAGPSSRALVISPHEQLTLDFVVKELEDVGKDLPKGGNIHFLDYKRMLMSIVIWLESKQDIVEKWDGLFKTYSVRSNLQFAEIKQHYWFSGGYNEKDPFMKAYYGRVCQEIKEKKGKELPMDKFLKNWFSAVAANIGRYFTTGRFVDVMKAFVFKVHAGLFGNGKCNVALPEDIQEGAKDFIRRQGGAWNHALVLPDFMSFLSFVNATAFQEGPIDNQGRGYLLEWKEKTQQTKDKKKGTKRKAPETTPKSSQSVGDSELESSQRMQYADSLSCGATQSTGVVSKEQSEPGGDDVIAAESAPQPLLRHSSVINQELEEMTSLERAKEDEKKGHEAKVAKLEAEIVKCKAEISLLENQVTLATVSEEADEYFTRTLGRRDAKMVGALIKQQMADFTRHQNQQLLISNIAGLLGLNNNADVILAYESAVAEGEGKKDQGKPTAGAEVGSVPAGTGIAMAGESSGSNPPTTIVAPSTSGAASSSSTLVTGQIEPPQAKNMEIDNTSNAVNAAAFTEPEATTAPAVVPAVENDLEAPLTLKSTDTGELPVHPSSSQIAEHSVDSESLLGNNAPPLAAVQAPIIVELRIEEIPVAAEAQILYETTPSGDNEIGMDSFAQKPVILDDPISEETSKAAANLVTVENPASAGIPIMESNEVTVANVVRVVNELDAENVFVFEKPVMTENPVMEEEQGIPVNPLIGEESVAPDSSIVQNTDNSAGNATKSTGENFVPMDMSSSVDTPMAVDTVGSFDASSFPLAQKTSDFNQEVSQDVAQDVSQDVSMPGTPRRRRGNVKSARERVMDDEHDKASTPNSASRRSGRTVKPVVKFGDTEPVGAKISRRRQK